MKKIVSLVTLLLVFSALVITSCKGKIGQPQAKEELSEEVEF